VQNYLKMKIINYIKESYNELIHKVSWPTSSEVFNSAVVVMIASLILALIVFLMDFSFEKVMTFIYAVKF
jgi:preprotein translocase subunit SecE